MATKPTTEPVVPAEPVVKPPEADKTPEPEVTVEDPFAIGKKVFLRSVHGPLAHTIKPETWFYQNKVTPVEVDWWIKIQYEAGKLTLAE